MSVKMRLNSGFTLLEVLVAFSIAVIVILMIYPKVVGFLLGSRVDLESMIVWESAVSELNHIKANPSRVGTRETLNIGNITVIVSSRILSGTIPPTPPQSGQNQTSCANVEVRAETAGGQVRRAILRGVVCRFS